MLSSKLKSWVESHLTGRKSKPSGGSNKKSGGHHKLSAQLHHQHEGASSSTLTADRIAHPASSLVGLIPTVPLCSSAGGRSNAALVIRLQNDLSSSTAGSPTPRHCHPPSWSQSPVMMAWGRRALQDTPSSSPLPPSRNNQQEQEQQLLVQAESVEQPSPSCSDWTPTNSFAGESGCGGGEGESTISSVPSLRADFHRTSGNKGGGAPSLSSPESAYSTGCSVEDGGGLSPTSSQDATTPVPEPPVCWTRILDTTSSALNSPRARPAIRTNPWLPVRSSLISYSSTDRSSWMTDGPSIPPLDTTPASSQYWSETSLPTSWPEANRSTPPKETDPLLVPAEGALLCDPLDEENGKLRVISDRVSQAYRPALPETPLTSGGIMSFEEEDDQYAKLIRQTEEILLQLENDEILLRMKTPEVQPPPVVPLSRPASATSSGRRSATLMRRSLAAARRYEVFSSSESSDCESYPSPAWRRPGSAQKMNRRRVTSRFADRQSGLIDVTPPPSSLPSRDCWILSSQRASCLPDMWTDSHDRPPSPAPMDPHCHWPVQRQRTSRSSSTSRHHQSSCPVSPAVRPPRHRAGQHTWREQQRLEMQIAFLRQQLKEVTDDYYDVKRRTLSRPDTPSSTTSVYSDSSTS